MRFLCDAMLGKLSNYLRILGFDTIYIKSMAMLNGYKKETNPALLFTKRKMQKSLYSNCIYIKSNNIIDQLAEIKNIIEPHIDKNTIMKRCIRCNTLLNNVKKDDIESLVPEFIFHTYDIFKFCPFCRKVYWEGSHVEHMKKWVKEIVS
ncbi:MAG: hypothetical protein NT178_14495 [Proteobacteria bacterium]|nr:hypothetical protein [Pseudomonadota bacterium]